MVGGDSTPADVPVHQERGATRQRQRQDRQSLGENGVKRRKDGYPLVISHRKMVI